LLRRLRTDHIDIYQVHWPDPLVTIEASAEAMRIGRQLQRSSTIRPAAWAAVWRPACGPVDDEGRQNRAQIP
jgi:aryl-alcohol dehydrogenase-like predicted oxidoreductase